MQRPRIMLAEDHAEMAEQLRNLLASEFDVDAPRCAGGCHGIDETAGGFHVPSRIAGSAQ